MNWFFTGFEHIFFYKRKKIQRNLKNYRATEKYYTFKLLEVIEAFSYLWECEDIRQQAVEECSKFRVGAQRELSNQQ